MPYCPKCGEKVKKGERFCSKCGSSLGEGNAYQRQELQRPQLIKRECAFCKGDKKKPGSLDPFPPNCCVYDGRGYNLILEDWRQCIICGGTGRKGSGGLLGDEYKPCSNCGGKGWAPD